MKSPVSPILTQVFADIGVMLGMFLLTSAYGEPHDSSWFVARFLVFFVIALLIGGLRAGLRRLVHGRGGANWDQHTWNRVVQAAERHAENHADPAIEERKKVALRAIDRNIKTRDLIESGELLPFDALRPYFEQRTRAAAPRRTGPPMQVPRRPVQSEPPAPSASEGDAD
jgi:hypothetical protein